MAEQSSTVTMFRALVMLVCLALIPLAAIGGNSFPAVVKAIQSGHLPTLADFRAGSGTPQRNLSEAPPFVPPQLSAAASSSAVNGSDSRSQQPSTAQAGMPSQPSFGGSQRMPWGESTVVAAGYNAPVNSPQRPVSDQSTSFPQNRVLQNGNFGSAASQGLSPLPAGAGDLRSDVRNGAELNSEAASRQVAADRQQPPRQEQSSPDALFRQIQDRLKQLGATYYLLEVWGERCDEFRFYCRMSIGGNPHVTKPFEQVDANPLTAMARVLEQVEEWQKGGTTSTRELTTGSAPDLR